MGAQRLDDDGLDALCVAVADIQVVAAALNNLGADLGFVGGRHEHYYGSKVVAPSRPVFHRAASAGG